MLYTQSGDPAGGVTVCIRLRSGLPDTSGRGLYSTICATTGPNGVFEITGVGTGVFVIVAHDAEGNVALIDSVVVDEPQTTTDVGADTLTPPGAITGVVHLSEGGELARVYVLLFGVNRFTVLDSTGRFVLDSLAEGAYDLRVVSSSGDYADLDTVGVPVASEQTTDLETLVLRYTGIPVPKGLTASYDTLKQIVTLTWKQADTSLVQGYSVYRTHADSSGQPVQLNAAVVVDTIFSDSTVRQDEAYTYQVSSWGRNGDEGVLSVETRVEVVSGFPLRVKLVASYIVDHRSLHVDKNGSMTFVTHDAPAVVRLDSSGALLSRHALGIANTCTGLAVDSQGNVYVGTEDGVYRFGAGDSLQLGFDTLPTPVTICAPQPHGMALADTLVFVAYCDRVAVYSLAGAYAAQWGSHGAATGQFSNPGGIVAQADSVFVYDLDNRTLQVFGADGELLGTVQPGIGGVQFSGGPTALAMDHVGRLVLAEQRRDGRVQVFTREGGLRGRFYTASPNNTPLAATADGRGRIYLSIRDESTGELSIRVYDAGMLGG
jgi:hypothetical protein